VTAVLDGVEAAVVAALDSVFDPELDESLLRLGFARAEVLAEGRVRVDLRLPTYWCAGNFAYLMADDARKAVAAVPGVRSVEVTLHDHFASKEVSSGVGRGGSFDDAFGDLSDGSGLEALRRLFWAKAFTMREEQLLRALVARGHTHEELAVMRLGDVTDGGELLARYVERRRRLDLPVDDDAPLAVMPNGRPIGAEELANWLRRARSTRISLEANTTLCLGLHATRYPDTAEVRR